MSTYQYRPLRQADSIRVVAFESEPHDTLMAIKLVEISLKDNIPFHALSYTWGDPKDSVTVHLGEYVLSVTVNLDQFLRRLRDNAANAEETQHYWADQICINQQD